MREYLQFYINGEWVDPMQAKPFEVIDPATEEVVGHINLGSQADVDKAVSAASGSFQNLVSNKQTRTLSSARPYH